MVFPFLVIKTTYIAAKLSFWLAEITSITTVGSWDSSHKLLENFKIAQTASSHTGFEEGGGGREGKPILKIPVATRRLEGLGQTLTNGPDTSLSEPIPGGLRTSSHVQALLNLD